jgi:hypothetical protein
MLALLGAQLYRVRGNPQAWNETAIVLALAFGLSVAWNVASLLIPRVVLDATGVSFRSRFGRWRRFATADVKGAVLRRVTWGGTARPSVFLIVYGPAHQTLFVLSRSYWGDDAITGIGSKLGHNTELHQVDTTSRKMAAEFRGSLAFSQRHPFLVVSVAAVIILGLVVTVSKPA